MGHVDPVLNPRFLRERLAEHLRQERERAKLKQDEAATSMRWSESKLQRIESCQVGISATDTRALLHLYGTQDQETVDRLMHLAQEARRRDRFTPYRKFFSTEYQTLLSHEQSATEVFMVNAFVLPGLLQIREYARALLSVKHAGDKLEGLVEAREIRKEIFERQDRPQFVFVVDESVLHRHVDGSRVLYKQLVYLRTIAKRPNVHLHVIPYTARAHLGLWEVYVIMTIPASTLTGEPDKTMVYRESGDTEFLVHDESRIAAYRKSFRSVLDQSLSRTETLELLDQLVDRLETSLTSPTSSPPM